MFALYLFIINIIFFFVYKFSPRNARVKDYVSRNKHRVQSVADRLTDARVCCTGFLDTFLIYYRFRASLITKYVPQKQSVFRFRRSLRFKNKNAVRTT